RVFVPLFLVFLCFFYWKKLKRNQIIFLVGSLVALGLIIVSLLFTGGARYSQVSVFSQPEVRLVLEEQLREDAHTPPIITRIFHNKSINYGRYLVYNYFRHLSFEFLFYSAENPIRERVPSTGVLYLIDMPFLLLGIYLILHKKIRWGYIVIGWILTNALVLSFTFDESPNIHRFITAVIPFEILVAFGITSFIHFFRKKRVLYISLSGLITILYLYSLLFYLHELFVHQPVHQPWFRNSAYKQMVSVINKNYDSYKKFVLTNTESNPYMFILFYNKYDPKKYQLSGSHGNENNKGFDKYVFVPMNCPVGSGNAIDPAKGDFDTMYMDRGDCINPPNAKVINLKWGDRSNAFKMMSLVKGWEPTNTSSHE